MKISVLASTYNWPEALELTLASLMSQSVLPDEIIIADDGSNGDTMDLINRIKSNSKIPIIHCWHEDRGFRLAKIRNLALSHCSAEYVIQIDGDIICHKEFIKDHLFYAEEGLFLAGRRADLNQADTNKSLQTSKLIITNKNNNKPSARIRSKLFMKLLKPSIVNKFISKGVQGSNMSFWVKDAHATGGYNEEIEGWGREDEEFVARLNRYGIRKKTIRFGAIQYHLEHPKRPTNNYVKNTEILHDTIIGNR